MGIAISHGDKTIIEVEQVSLGYRSPLFQFIYHRLKVIVLPLIDYLTKQIVDQHILGVAPSTLAYKRPKPYYSNLR